MAQRICDDCGNRIPEGHPWCPVCGIRRRATDRLADPDARLTWRRHQKRRGLPWDRLAPLGIVFVLTTSAIVVGFQSRAHSLTRRVSDALTVAFSVPGFGTTPSVRIRAEATEADTYCSLLRGLLGTCVQVHCAVTNSGNTAGTAVVTATVESAAQTLTRRRELLLSPGESERITFTFREARAGYRFRARCDAGVAGS